MTNDKTSILGELVRLFVLITSDRQYDRVLDAMEEEGYGGHAVLDVIGDVNGCSLEEPLPNPFERRRRSGGASVIRLVRESG